MKTQEEKEVRIKEIARQNDADVIWGKNDYCALLGRIYDSQGVEIVRYRPDPCHFKHLDWWLAASPESVTKAVC